MKIIGIVFVIVGAIIFLADIIKRVMCKQEITGIVVNICKVTSFKGDGGKKRKFYPVFQYNVDGTSYIKKSTKGYVFYKYELGDNIKIKYNPKNPKQYYVKGNISNIIMSAIWIITGIMIILTGQRV